MRARTRIVVMRETTSNSRRTGRVSGSRSKSRGRKEQPARTLGIAVHLSDVYTSIECNSLHKQLKNATRTKKISSREHHTRQRSVKSQHTSQHGSQHGKDNINFNSARRLSYCMSLPLFLSLSPSLPHSVFHSVFSVLSLWLSFCLPYLSLTLRVASRRPRGSGRPR